MTLRHTALAGLLVVAGVAVAVFAAPDAANTLTRIRSSASPKASYEMKRARAEQTIWMLRDPATGQIPRAARDRELQFASLLSSANRSAVGSGLPWSVAGPYDVAGRTRAIAIDRADASSNTLLAGGTSGGMFRSTDAGVNWTLVSPPSDGLSVTSVVQDPRAGQENTWYYATGEFDGTAFANTSGQAQNLFAGQGLFKSTDGGLTWAVLPATRPATPSSGSTGPELWDYVSRVAVNPTSGTVYAASNGFGVQRSTDGGATWTCSIGACTSFGATYSDVRVTTGGVVLAAFSGDRTVPQGVAAGLHASYDDGATWTDITPTSFDEFTERTVIATSGNVAWTLTWNGDTADDGFNDFLILYRLTVTPGGGTAPVIIDRTENLPYAIEASAQSKVLDTQGSYNMALAASPLDPNYVVMGTTNLFRTTDGFATPVTQDEWIGGYDPVPFLDGDPSVYPAHHPDNHEVVWDPAVLNKVWSGHDGGISLTTNVTASTVSWTTRERGFNVTQFFHMSLSPMAGSPVALGGAQDNGSPFFQIGNATVASSDVTTGDGANSFTGNSWMFAQAQTGFTNRYAMVIQNGNTFPTPDLSTNQDIPKPDASGAELFINPIAVDPVGESVLFHPAGSTLWRSTTADGADGDAVAASYAPVAVPGVGTHIVSALSMTTAAPAHRLWAAYFSPDAAPKLYRIDNANATVAPVEVSIPGAPSGSWIGDIGVNPANGDEAVAVLTNYGITGLYHTLNGGNSWTAIEGNLTGDATNLGPSLRSAAIVTPADGGARRYFVATTVGVFSTTALAGDATVWVQEGAAAMGNVPATWIAARGSDGTVLAATHGRGAFSTVAVSVANEDVADGGALRLSAPAPNPVRSRSTIRYTLAQASDVELVLTDMRGRRVAMLTTGVKSAGDHQATLERGSLAAGVYVLTLRADGRSVSQRAVVTR